MVFYLRIVVLVYEPLHFIFWNEFYCPMACAHASTNTFGFLLFMRPVDCSRHFAPWKTSRNPQCSICTETRLDLQPASFILPAFGFDPRPMHHGSKEITGLNTMA